MRFAALAQSVFSFGCLCGLPSATFYRSTFIASTKEQNKTSFPWYRVEPSDWNAEITRPLQCPRKKKSKAAWVGSAPPIANIVVGKWSMCVCVCRGLGLTIERDKTTAVSEYAASERSTIVAQTAHNRSPTLVAHARRRDIATLQARKTQVLGLQNLAKETLFKWKSKRNDLHFEDPVTASNTSFFCSAVRKDSAYMLERSIELARDRFPSSTLADLTTNVKPEARVGLANGDNPSTAVCHCRRLGEERLSRFGSQQPLAQPLGPHHHRGPHCASALSFGSRFERLPERASATACCRPVVGCCCT